LFREILLEDENEWVMEDYPTYLKPCINLSTMSDYFNDYVPNINDSNNEEVRRKPPDLGSII
jgi:hypothetical protein